MKTLNIQLTDEEYETLKKKKKQVRLNWHDFVMVLSTVDFSGYEISE